MNIFIPVMVAILMIGSVALYIALNETSKTIEKTNRQTINRIQESVEVIFSEADAQSLNYSVSPSVMMRLEELLKEGNRSEEIRQTAAILKTILDSNVNSKDFLHSIYIYIKNDNRNFFASNKGLANDSNVSDSEWMTSLDSAPRDIQQWIEARSIGKFTGITQYKTDVISLFKWFHISGRAGRQGVLVLNIEKGYLQKLFQSNLSYKGQNILMVDNAGNILCSSSANDAGDIHDLSFLYSDHFVQVSTNDALGVEYISFIPKAVLTLQSNDMIFIIALAILIALALCSLIAIAITKENVRNIDAIMALLRAAEQKQKLPQPTGANDVYGYITQEIVQSYLHRNQLNQQLMEKKINLEAMRFQFLQAQLNPHFLFNTLKNIYWKTVRLSGLPNEASKMIELLSSVLHYTLVHPQRYVPLEEEIDNTRKYIQIQKMRFDYAFIDEWDVDPELLNERCIKFLLQPLLENSISHGLTGKEGGVIRIMVQSQTDRIGFSVRDNGHGLSEKKLDEVRKNLEAENSPVEHIGLYNVNKRLILAYDNASSICIESTYGEYTLVSFSIPRLTQRIAPE